MGGKEYRNTYRSRGLVIVLLNVGETFLDILLRSKNNGRSLVNGRRLDVQDTGLA